MALIRLTLKSTDTDPQFESLRYSFFQIHRFTILDLILLTFKTTPKEIEFFKETGRNRWRMQEAKEVLSLQTIISSCNYRKRRHWSHCFEINKQRNIDHERNSPNAPRKSTKECEREKWKLKIDSWKEYVRNVMAKFDEMSPTKMKVKLTKETLCWKKRPSLR